MYSCSAQLISLFEIDSNSKEINCAEHEYMNMFFSFIEMATLLLIRLIAVYVLKLNMHVLLFILIFTSTSRIVW